MSSTTVSLDPDRAEETCAEGGHVNRERSGGMKIKKSTDTMIAVPGYVMEVEQHDGYLTLGTGGRYDYVLPDGYVCVTMSDPNGDSIYVLAPKSTRVFELDQYGKVVSK